LIINDSGSEFQDLVPKGTRYLQQ